MIKCKWFDQGIKSTEIHLYIDAVKINLNENVKSVCFVYDDLVQLASFFGSVVQYKNSVDQSKD